MKLLMVSGDRSILKGKKGAFWYTLEEFCKHWERIDVICPKIPNSKYKIPKESQIPNPKNPLFGSVFFHPCPRGLWYQPFWIKKKGKELFLQHHYNVMTAHEYPPFYNGLGARMLYKATKIPYVLEIHHIVGYPDASSFTELIGRWMSWMFLRWDAEHASAVRCVNEDVKGVIGGWGVEKTQVIPSFYLDKESLVSDSSIEKKYDVVFCGRDVPNKGLKELRIATDTIGASLLAIGSDQWLDTKEDVYTAMQSGRIFVMNSKSEGGPRVLLEAMALGLPVISTRVGVAPHVIRDGINGMFTTGDSNDLAQKIKTLLDDKDLQKRLGDEARTIECDRETLVRGYADFLKSFT